LERSIRSKLVLDNSVTKPKFVYLKSESVLIGSVFGEAMNHGWRIIQG